jgi:hypothetical protein
MPHRADLDADDRALLRSILEEEDPPEPDDAAIEAALAEPVLAGIVERSMESKARLLTDKGRERMRRTLAVVFLTDPRAISLLAQARAEAGSATVSTGTPNADTTRRSGRTKTK